jgi:hypothetical protein
VDMGRGEYTRKKTRNRNPSKSQLQFAEKCIKQIEPGNIDWLIKMTCLSFFCYVFDVGWDIYLLHRFWNQGDYWYFGWTLAIVVVPIVVITIKSFLFYNNEFEKNNELDPRLYLPQEENTTSNWLIKWGFGIVGFCLVQRYVSDLINFIITVTSCIVGFFSFQPLLGLLMLLNMLIKRNHCRKN